MQKGNFPCLKQGSRKGHFGRIILEMKQSECCLDIIMDTALSEEDCK